MQLPEDLQVAAAEIGFLVLLVVWSSLHSDLDSVPLL